MTDPRYVADIVRTKGKHLSVRIEDREFLLYPTEIRHLGLSVGREIEEDGYEEMLQLLSRRALKYSAQLLKTRDYSVKMLKDRLRIRKYPEECIGYAVDCLRDKNYLNDERYAENYCMSKQEVYGKQRLKNELLQRGIDIEIITKVLEEREGEVDPRTLIETYAEKKGFDKNRCDRKERDRFYRYLVGKGINYSDIADFFS